LTSTPAITRSGDTVALPRVAPARRSLPSALLLILFAACALPAVAQDLAPRAYLITPLHANAVVLTWSWYTGGLNFNGTIPITNASGTYSVPVFSYYHSLNFFGHSSNVTASLPYGIGTFSGEAIGKDVSVYRSGLLDFSARFSVNLLGGHAMEPVEFARWKQKRLLGVSLKVIAPTGQYSSTKLVNWSINRWAFKPEIGYSRRFHNWLIDAYGGAWLYTTNPAMVAKPVPVPQTESPVGSFEGHLSYDFDKNRAWASLDGNFWWGGVTALNGVSNPNTRQTGSRIGGTVSLPFTKHQSIKIAYSNGTYIRFGGNYQNLQVAWQYSWIGWPK
jgi:hypothetical protein